MVIRATVKVLNIAGIKPVKNAEEIASELPGEWYVGLVSMNKPGKMALCFLHNPTMMIVLVSGKSLNKALPIFRERAKNLLMRSGYGKLVFQFQLQTEQHIYASNSRSLLGHMNQIRYAIEHYLALEETVELIDWDKMEDWCLDLLCSRDKKYFKPTDILSKLME